MLIVADALGVPVSEPPRGSVAPTTNVTRAKQCAGVCPTQRELRDPGTHVDGGVARGNNLSASVRGVGVSKLPVLPPSPTPHVSVPEGGAGVRQSRCDMADGAADFHCTNTRGELGVADIVVIAVAELAVSRPAPTPNITCLEQSAGVIFFSSNLSYRASDVDRPTSDGTSSSPMVSVLPYPRQPKPLYPQHRMSAVGRVTHVW